MATIRWTLKFPALWLAVYTLMPLVRLRLQKIAGGEAEDNYLGWWTIYPGTIHPGTIYPGTIYPGTIYPGTIYHVTIHPGTIHPGQFTPGQFTPGQFTPGLDYSLNEASSFGK